MNKDSFPGFERRKKEYTRDIHTRNTFGISWGCMRNILVLLFFLILFLIALYLYSHGYVGVYNGENKGIFFMNWNLEIVGTPGFSYNPG